MALLHVNCFSDTLGMCVDLDVILPEQAQNRHGETPYPTLYLLHGKSDNHTSWQRYTSIERYAKGRSLAVVMPAVQLSFYTDMYRGGRYADYITRELPAICRSFFRGMSEKREDTFIAGLSMGGYGAIRSALASDMFSAAASLSGALDAALLARDRILAGDAYWECVFGPVDKIGGSDNDLFELAKRRKRTGAFLPKLYMWCGTEDFLYGQNIKARDSFLKLGYDLTYEQSPGDHQWCYWDEKIQRVLDWLPIGQ